MQITLFGVVWCVILFIACLRGTKALTKCVLFSAIMQSGLVLVIGDSALSPLVFSCLVYIVRYFVFNPKKKIVVPSFAQYGLLFWGVILVSSLISSAVFRGMRYMVATGHVTYARYDGSFHLLSLGYLLLFIVTGILMYNSVHLDAKDVHGFLTFCVWFVAVVGVWQVLTMSKVLPRVSLLEDLIYSNYLSWHNILYYNLQEMGIEDARFQSSFMEPSYCAGFLALAFYYFVSQERLSNADKVIICAILAMTVMTFSATAYPAVAFAGLLALFTTDRKKLALKILQRGILLVVGALIIVNLTGLWPSVESWILNKSDSGSAYIRGLWNLNSLQTFKDTMLLGLGYETARGSSLLFTLPVSIGLLGTVTYLCFILSPGWHAKRHNTGKRYAMMIITVTVAQLISIGILGYTILWASYLLFCTAEDDAAAQYQKKRLTG